MFSGSCRALIQKRPQEQFSSRAKASRWPSAHNLAHVLTPSHPPELLKRLLAPSRSRLQTDLLTNSLALEVPVRSCAARTGPQLVVAVTRRHESAPAGMGGLELQNRC